MVVRHPDDPDHPRDATAREVQSVTSAPQSAAEDQAERMRRYLLTMAFRVVCCGLALVASGWLRWTLVAAAVVLPYVAVVMANAVGPRAGREMAPVEPSAEHIPALDVSPTDDADRTIHGRVVDD